jgi:hypothetical protein
MVWDDPLPSGPRVSWHHHTFRNPTEEQAAADRDPKKVLTVVSAQTGLTFTGVPRMVDVIYLNVADQK